LRTDNDALKGKIIDSINEVKKEREGKVKVFNDHADLVNTYNKLVAKYEETLINIEAERKDAEKEANATFDELSQETANEVNLNHHSIASTQGKDSLKGVSNGLRNDLEGLKKHYATFESQLTQFVTTQTTEITNLEKDLEDKAKGINDLQKELSDSVTTIIELHETVDRANAANLNSKLSQLTSNLVEADKYRREAQNKLENAQEGWTAKLKLFEDEASRMSRENANQKRAAEVEKLLNKLDKLNQEKNEIAKERDEFDKKRTTDNNRDAIEQNLNQEKEKLELKNRWANDEIAKTLTDLEEILKFLDFKKQFLTDQEEQIKMLRTEIEETRVKITECTTIIIELEGELEELNTRIEELLKLIAEKDNEIEELQRTLDERLRTLADLEGQLNIKSSYVAVKGDMVDEMLAQYIQN